MLLFTVQNIVPKVGTCERLKTALYRRLGKDDLSIKQREDFTKIKDWLVFSANNNVNRLGLCNGEYDHSKIQSKKSIN